MSVAGRNLLADQVTPTAGSNLLPDAPPPPDPSRMSRIAAAMRFNNDPSAGDVFAHNITLGLQRPITGAMEGVRSLFGGEGFSPGYRAGEAAYDEFLNEAREQSGWGGTAAGVAGSLLSGGPVRSAVANAPSLLRSARDAAVLSGIQGTAEAEGSLPERLTEGGTSAAIGGVTGGALHGALRVPGFSARRAAAREAARGPQPDQLRSEAQALYQQLDDAAVAYDAGQAQTLHHDILARLGSRGYNPNLHPVTGAVLNDLERATSGPMSLSRLQQVREQAREAASSLEPRERLMSGRLIDEIDRFVETVDPPTGTMGRQDIGSTWQQARQLWRAANVSEDVLWKVGKAERRAASTNSGANTENALRQNIRGMMDKAEDPRRANPYNPAEMAQMGRVVEGTGPQNFLRSVGNTFGGSGPLALGPSAGLLGGSAMAGLDPLLATGLGIGSWALGKGARTASSRMAENEVDELVRLIASGGGPRPPAAPVQGPPTPWQAAGRQALSAGTGKLPLAGRPLVPWLTDEEQRR